MIARIYRHQYNQVLTNLEHKTYYDLPTLLSDSDVVPIKRMNFQGEIVKEPSELVHQLTNYVANQSDFSYPYAADQLTITTQQTPRDLYTQVLNITGPRLDYLLSRNPTVTGATAILSLALSLELIDSERTSLSNWIQTNLYINQQSLFSIYSWLESLSRFVSQGQQYRLPVYINRPEGNFTRSPIIYIGITPQLDDTDMNNLQLQLTEIMSRHNSISVPSVDTENLLVRYTVKYFTSLTSFISPWFFYLRPVWTIPILRLKSEDSHKYQQLEQRLKLNKLYINYQNAVVSDYKDIIPPQQVYIVEPTPGSYVYHLAKTRQGDRITTNDQLDKALDFSNRSEGLLIKGINRLSINPPTGPTPLSLNLGPIIPTQGIAGLGPPGTTSPSRAITSTNTIGVSKPGGTSMVIPLSELNRSIVPVQQTTVNPVKPVTLIFGPITVINPIKSIDRS